MWECSALGAEFKNVHSFAPHASVGLPGDLGVHFSNATAFAIFGMVRSGFKPKGRATYWATLVARPVVSLLRSPKCSRNIPALHVGPWG